MNAIINIDENLVDILKFLARDCESAVYEEIAQQDYVIAEALLSCVPFDAEKMRDEIIQDIQNGVIQRTKGSERLFEIIDKHTGGKENDA